MEYQVSSSGIKAVISSTGAELIALEDSKGRSYLWNRDARYWKSSSPILFPFVARLTEGIYTYKGISYPMEKHGFVRNSELECLEQTDDSILLRLVSDEDLNTIYPFDFTFDVSYKAVGNKLVISYIVTNVDDKPMYYGLGSHPGFKVPIDDTLAFEDYEIFFPKASIIRQELFSPDCFYLGVSEPYPLEGNALPLRHDLFDNDAIVLTGTGTKAVIRSSKSDRSLTVSYDTPYVGLWHAVKTDAPYVCIEPWYSLPAEKDKVIDLETKKDFFRLEAGRENIHKLEIEIG